jgi:hypothetical protein
VGGVTYDWWAAREEERILACRLPLKHFSWYTRLFFQEQEIQTLEEEVEDSGFFPWG